MFKKAKEYYQLVPNMYSLECFNHKIYICVACVYVYSYARLLPRHQVRAANADICSPVERGNLPCADWIAAWRAQRSVAAARRILTLHIKAVFPPKNGQSFSEINLLCIPSHLPTVTN